MTASAVLVLNCGSSSVKFAGVDPPSGRRLLSGLAERVGTPEVTLEIDTGVDTGTDTDVDTDVAAEVDAGKPRTSTPQDGSVHGILVEVLAAVGRVQDVQVGAVGHRVVHGGERFTEPELVTYEIAGHRTAGPVGAADNPAHALGIRAIRSVWPDVPQVAVFDTAFHRTIPDARLALRRAGRALHEHGSAATASTAPATLTSRPGSPAAGPTAALQRIRGPPGQRSPAAVRDGRSVDTSMGYTPLEGLVMGTRSGDVDPGLLRLPRRPLRLRGRGGPSTRSTPAAACSACPGSATTCAR